MNTPGDDQPAQQSDAEPRARQGPTVFGLPLPALAVLLLTAAMALAWSQYKLINQDEMFVVQTDGVSTLGQVVHIQHHYPISLDPLVFHVLAHASMRYFGVNATALRLPSLLGYLLMQVCIFWFVRRCFTDRRLGERVGVVAMAFPALTATLFYAAEGRPYGLLLGFYALTLLCWQAAARGEHRHRSAVLCALVLAIALTLNTHYFGVLVLIPLCAAELFRTWQHRRPDWPVIFAIAIGIAGIVFALPFQKAAGEFRKHYYNTGWLPLRVVAQSYRTLLLDYTRFSQHTQRLLALAFILATALFLLALLYRLAKSAPPRTRGVNGAEAVFAFVLAIMPLFGILLANVVTHSLEVRYVLGAIIGIALLLGWTLAPALDRAPIYRTVVVLLLVGVAVNGLANMRVQQKLRDHILDALRFPPEVTQAAMADPTHMLYFQNVGAFEMATFYEPDAAIRAHMALVYSPEREIQWDHHDTGSLTAMHMRFFTGFPIVSYEQMARRPGEHTFIVFNSGWDWAAQAFAADHATITELGPAYDGRAISVHFASPQ